MDKTPILKRSLREIAEAILALAKEQKWADKDYRWYFRFNEVWDQLHIILVARAFEGRTYEENYSLVRNYLSKKLADAPDIAKSFGLVVMDPGQVEKGGVYTIGPEFEDYWAFRPVQA